MKNRLAISCLLSSILIISLPCQVHGNIPDTGEIYCYDNTDRIPCPLPGEPFYGQDAHYSIHPPSFTKLDADGNALPGTAVQWVTVRDNVTGLIWEIKQSPDMIQDYANPHDADNTYTWYNPDPLTNGGNAGTQGNGTDTRDFIDALNASGYGGYSDWRMPTVKELLSLINFGAYDPSIHEIYFPRTPSLTFWSTSPSPFYTSTTAWTVNFLSGTATFIDPKSISHTVRAVRSGTTDLFDDGIPPERMTDNGDGTVIDTATGLVWQKQDDGIERDWQSALQYCENLELAGKTDWRLPSINELTSIVDMSSPDPAILPVFFNTKSTYYWSATTSPHDDSDLTQFADLKQFAGSIVFFMGQPEFTLKTDSHYVRAVRYGGSDPPVDDDEPPAPENLSATLTSDVTSGLAPAEVQFATFVTQGIPLTYDYDFGDGTTRDNADRIETHTYQTPGNYTVTVTVTDANDRTLQLQKNILVLNTTQISEFTDTIETRADRIIQATDGRDISSLLENIDDITEKTLESIARQEDDFKVPVQTSVQTTVEKMAADTDTRLNTLIEENKVTATDLTDISSEIKGVVSQMVKTGIPVTGDTIGNLTSISETIYTRTLDSLLKNENLDQTRIDTLKTDKSESRDFLRSKPYLLDNIAAGTGIQVDTTVDFKADVIADRAEYHKLTEQQTGRLFNAVENTLDISGSISTAADLSGSTIAKIAEHIYNTYYGKTVVKATMDDITKSLILEFSDGSCISFVVKAVHIVADFMPPGLFTLPDGSMLGVTDTYAMEFTAYPAFPHALAADIIKLNLAPVLTRDSGLRIQLTPSTQLVMKPGWDYLKLNSFDSLATSFSIVGGTNPASEAYALMATYDTGFSQLLPPAIMALDSLTDTLDTLIPGDYHFERFTGVLFLGGMKFKPDYMFTTATQIDYAAITAAGGFTMDRLAVELVDVNNDGLTDIILHSDNPMGRQVLYTVGK